VIARVGANGEVARADQAASANGGSASGPVRERVKASPVARRIAAAAELELGSISGSGPGGRIVKADVQKALASGSASAMDQLPSPLSAELPTTSSPAQAGSRVSSLEHGEAPSAQPSHAAPARPLLGAGDKSETAKGTVSIVELTKLQQTVSRRMAESKATAPHFYRQAEIDMTRAHEARRQIKSGAESKRPSFNDMVVKACAIALREFRRANGAYRDGKWELYSRVNVGIAVAAREALVVPTIFDADEKGLRQIATESRALASRVREGTVTPPELSGGTFTVSNSACTG